ncbi:MAG: hypothetical protein KatS3mg002_0351 [Candidatus Woesearchaeota archaeon]|nr:MAG: hypothetical protein KatS3mg002_0351 [Candidatus Woesearchaeota archaeon]
MKKVRLPKTKLGKIIFYLRNLDVLLKSYPSHISCFYASELKEAFVIKKNKLDLLYLCLLFIITEDINSSGLVSQPVKIVPLHLELKSAQVLRNIIRRHPPSRWDVYEECKKLKLEEKHILIKRLLAYCDKIELEKFKKTALEYIKKIV